MHQRVDQSATGLLDGNGDGFTPKAIPQQLNPVLQGLWRVIHSEPLALIAAGLLQGDNVLLVGPIQSYKCGDFDILFQHQSTSPIVVSRVKNLPEGSAHNPYSRVLEGQHLSICPTPHADRVRKSPPTVETVGWRIRNATQPVFHKGNLLQKEKEKRTKKEKEKGPVENAAAMEIRKTIGGLRLLFVDADSHNCLEKPRKNRSAFPHLPQARRRLCN
jgi:hypothetical protein